MQARRAAGKQAVAQVGHHIQPEGANRRQIVAIAFQLLSQPARDFGAAGVGEARQLHVVADRHDAGNDGDADAERARVFDEVEVGVGVEEILRDRGVGAGVDLALEVGQILGAGTRLRVDFGIGGDFDFEPVAGFLADEGHQFVGVVELAGVHGARGQVAAQRDQMADALAFVCVEDVADALFGRADARQVRRGFRAGGLDLAHGFQGAVAGRAAGAEGHGKELGLELRQLLARGAQLLGAFRRLGREEFKAVSAFGHTSTFFVGDERGQRPGDHAVQDGADHRRHKALHLEAGQQRAGEPEQQAVQHQVEDAQRQHRDRQREERQHRPHQRVDEAEHQRGDQRRAEARHLNGGQQLGHRQQGDGIQNPQQQQTHGALLSGEADQ